uniref:Uncharacterized protein n=1 Tax=Romanomermis culicivorax TaxID=13658 RepID=A0A915JJ82_ROMCU
MACICEGLREHKTTGGKLSMARNTTKVASHATMQDAVFNLFLFMHKGSNKFVNKFDASLKDLAVKCMFDEITSVIEESIWST